MPPLRIVYVLTSLGVGGAERQVAALGRSMSRDGHAVSLLVLRPPLAEELDTALPIIHLNLRKNPFSLAAALFRARRVLLDLHPDLVHSHSFHANIFARLLRLAGASPVVLSTVHNIYEGGRLRMLAYRVTDGLSLHTTAVSQAVAQRFIERKAVPLRKISVLTNAIDLSEFTPDHIRRAETRTRMAAGENFIWLAAGRLSPAKDYPTLLRAFAQLRTSNPSTRLWMTGQGTRAELDALEAAAASLNLTERVSWLGLRRDLPALLDAADAFVLSSAWEGMPLVVAEAMAMEKPVVATDVGGVRELVAEAGLIVPPHSPKSLAEAMQSVMHQSNELRQAHGHAARLRIRQHFNLDSRTDEWESFYQDLLERAR